MPTRKYPKLNIWGEPHQPGDRIIAKYIPDATSEEREEARENLRKLAMAYVGIIERVVREGKGDLLKKVPPDESSNPVRSHQENKETSESI